MAEVTYLLGAGASAQCVPVVGAMSKDIKDAIDDLRTKGQNFRGMSELTSFGNTINLSEVIPAIVRDLETLRTACEDHYSVDTYAKKLFLTDRSSFYKLKAILSFYFTFIQLVRQPDKRYDNMWASFLTDSSYRLPRKIKILSWNYDFQVEKSYMGMSNCENMNQVVNRINMFSTENADKDRLNADEFAFIKLNGSARTTELQSNAINYMCNFDSGMKDKLIKELIIRYATIKSNQDSFKSHLHFAWETTINGSFFSTINRVLANTEVLVIIGYSFPFFNRIQDQQILSSMPNLQKVYIQDMNPSAIRERFIQLRDGLLSIELVSDVNQFAFPKELEIDN